jgi:hypothetical protein
MAASWYANPGRNGTHALPGLVAHPGVTFHRVTECSEGVSGTPAGPVTHSNPCDPCEPVMTPEAALAAALPAGDVHTDQDFRLAVFTLARHLKAVPGLRTPTRAGKANQVSNFVHLTSAHPHGRGDSRRSLAVSRGTFLRSRDGPAGRPWVSGVPHTPPQTPQLVAHEASPGGHMLAGDPGYRQVRSDAPGSGDRPSGRVRIPGTRPTERCGRRARSRWRRPSSPQDVLWLPRGGVVPRWAAGGWPADGSITGGVPMDSRTWGQPADLLLSARRGGGGTTLVRISGRRVRAG